jgi:transcriptional regulator NrdR family protein
MNCPKCESKNIKTKDVRSFYDPAYDFFYVERKRVCLNCEHPFKTIEMDIEDYQRVLSGEINE